MQNITVFYSNTFTCLFLTFLLFLPFPVHAGGERGVTTSNIDTAFNQLVSLYAEQIASEFTAARETCTLSPGDSVFSGDGNVPLTIALFTLEGFGGGNNHTQYLAVVRGARLMGSTPIGGKGWR